MQTKTTVHFKEFSKKHKHIPPSYVMILGAHFKALNKGALTVLWKTIECLFEFPCGMVLRKRPEDSFGQHILTAVWNGNWHCNHRRHSTTMECSKAVKVFTFEVMVVNNVLIFQYCKSFGKQILSHLLMLLLCLMIL